MSRFERHLSLWVLLCILAGIALGRLAPGLTQALGGMEVARVNLPVAALIWLMITPMLLKIDFAALGKVGRSWRGVSGAALATVVGVLVEVPAMLSVVWIVNRSKDWYEAARD